MTEVDRRVYDILSLVTGDNFTAHEKLVDDVSKFIHRCDVAISRGELDQMEVRHRAMVFLSRHTPKLDVLDVESISAAVCRLCDIITGESYRT